MAAAASRTSQQDLGIGASQADVTSFSRRSRRHLLHFLHAKHESSFGFWNLQRSLSRDTTQLTELSAKLASSGVSTCGLAGAWSWDSGRKEGDGCTVLWSGGGTGVGHSQGVGLFLGPREAACLQHWEAVSDRLLWARFSGTINLSIVVTYAPVSQQNGRSAAESRRRRKEYFEDVERLLDRIPGLDFQLILGDFNSRVGRACGSDNSVLGRHSLAGRNAAGEELLQFCRRRKLAVANTFFPTRCPTDSHMAGTPAGQRGQPHRWPCLPGLRACQEAVAVQCPGRACAPRRGLGPKAVPLQRPSLVDVRDPPQTQATKEDTPTAPTRQSSPGRPAETHCPCRECGRQNAARRGRRHSYPMAGLIRRSFGCAGRGSAEVSGGPATPPAIHI